MGVTVKEIIFHTFGTNSLARKLIGYRLASEFSHTAIQFGDLVYEATMFGGVQRFRLSGMNEPLVSTVLKVSKEDYERTEKLAISLLGSSYDFKAILGFILAARIQGTNNYFCSEYGFLLFKEATGFMMEQHDLMPPGNLRGIVESYSHAKK